MQGNFLWLDTLYNGDVTNQRDKWDCFRSSPAMKDSIAYIGKGTYRCNLSDDRLTSNIYYYRLIAGEKSIQGKLIFTGNR